MRSIVLSKAIRRSVQGVSLIILAGIAAGCSSNTARFTDDFYTGATPNQQSIINNQGGYQQMPPQAGSIESSQLPPVQSQAYPPAPQPVQTASAGQLGTPPQNLGTLPATSVSSPVTTTASAQTHNGSYVVQSGDTLYSISRKTGVGVEKLKQANGLSNGAIRVGQSLVIPGAAASTRVAAAQTPKAQTVSAPQVAAPAKTNEVKTVVVTPSNTTTKAAQTTTAPVSQPAVAAPSDTMQKATDVAVVAPQATGISQMRWPARGKILSSFGQKEGTSTNDGIDIMLPEGSPVKAAENGVVIYAGDGLKEFGQTVLIKHENNIVTVYGHNSKILVQRGQQIRRGDEIAKSGMSGNATNPRLHFEVRKNSAPVNPIKYLEN